MKTKIIICAIIVILFQFQYLQQHLYADEVILKNQDRISGAIIEESDEKIVVETEAMGRVDIKREFVETIKTEETKIAAEEEEPKLWQKDVSLGYNKSSGNTQNSQLSLNLFLNRKTEDDEFTVKGDSYHSSSNKKMDAQKWNGMVRYAYSFWERKWYNFYKIEGDHDRFANIDYRLIPSTGVGYWFSDKNRP